MKYIYRVTYEYQGITMVFDVPAVSSEIAGELCRDTMTPILGSVRIITCRVRVP